jgi:hypothetical protein
VQRSNFNRQAAYEFYKEYLLDVLRQKTMLYDTYGFKTVGCVTSQDWELFGAILLNDRAKGGDVGSDLQHYEVKSAVTGNSFEYQYHRNHGLEKLEEDMQVDHLFISYDRDYAGVTVRLVSAAALQRTFLSWRPGLIRNYQGDNPKLRYRRSVSYGFVERNGAILMEIRKGILVV